MSPVFGHGRLRLYLLKLLEEEPRHGYDIIRGLEDRFMGLYAPSAGTVYPRLARLEAEGLVSHSDDEGRKVYRITNAGRVELRTRAAELADVEREIAEAVRSVRDTAQEIRSEVRGAVADLRSELRQAAREVRRQDRVTARAASSRETLRAAGDAEALITAFRAEARRLVRDNGLDETRLAALRSVLDDALGRLREVVAPR